jgi:hypothetical protein
LQQGPTLDIAAGNVEGIQIRNPFFMKAESDIRSGFSDPINPMGIQKTSNYYCEYFA